LPQPGAVKVTFEDRVAVRMEDCDKCLVKDNLAALVGEWSQTNEGMGESVKYEHIQDGYLPVSK
jgi:hypothetical protein